MKPYQDAFHRPLPAMTSLISSPIERKHLFISILNCSSNFKQLFSSNRPLNSVLKPKAAAGRGGDAAI